MKNISLRNMYLNGEISRRVHTICNENGIYNLYDLMNFYLNECNFNKLNNCGEAANTELVILCLKYGFYSLWDDAPHPDFVINNQYEIYLSKFNKLNSKYQYVILKLLNVKIASSSLRSKRVLRDLIGINISFDKFTDFAFNWSNNLDHLSRLGYYSKREIKNHIEDILQLVELFTKKQNKSIDFKNFALHYLKILLPIKNEKMNSIINDIDFQKKLPLFKIIDALINDELLFNSNETYYFKNSFGYYLNEKKYNLKKAAQSIGLSFERGRQLRIGILNNFENTFSFIVGFDENDIDIYDCDVSAGLFTIDEHIADKINQSEHVNFSLRFIKKIMSIFLGFGFDCIGKSEKITNSEADRNSLLWKNTYLVRKDISGIFDFNGLIIDVKKRLSEEIYEPYDLIFINYILKYFNIDPHKYYDFLTTILKISETMIQSEFDMKLSKKSTLEFKRNKKYTKNELIYNVLKQINKPAKLKEIHRVFHEMYPNFSINLSSLSVYCQKGDQFIYFGRSSVWGLKEWEKEKNIKGGTIRDIVEEYLQMFDEPKHIKDIYEYTKKYRTTSLSLILTNLNLDKTNRFTVYKGNFIGLNSKNYKNKLTKKDELKTQIKTWDEKFSELEHYVNKHKRLPSCIGDVNEKKLYNFYLVQIDRFKIGKNQNDRIDKILKLLSDNNIKIDLNKRHIGKEMHFLELLEFVKKNGRLPKSTLKEEVNLYQFWGRQMRLFRKGVLNEKQRLTMNEIIDLLKLVI